MARVVLVLILGLLLLGVAGCGREESESDSRFIGDWAQEPVLRKGSWVSPTVIRVENGGKASLDLFGQTNARWVWRVKEGKIEFRAAEQQEKLEGVGTLASDGTTLSVTHQPSGKTVHYTKQPAR